MHPFSMWNNSFLWKLPAQINPRHGEKMASVSSPPESSCTRNILSAVWLVTEHCYPSTRIRVEREDEEDGAGEGVRENWEDAFIPRFSLGVCVYLACHHLHDGRTAALNPSVSKPRGRAGRSVHTRHHIRHSGSRCDHNAGSEHEK